MPRPCSICIHPAKADIDSGLIAGDETFRTIAHRFACSEDALKRHKGGHLPTALVKTEEAREVAQAGTLLDQVRNLQIKALSILQKAEQAGDLRTALIAIREGRSTLELLGRISGELDERTRVNVLNVTTERPLEKYTLDDLDAFLEHRRELREGALGSDNISYVNQPQAQNLQIFYTPALSDGNSNGFTPADGDGVTKPVQGAGPDSGS